jgi:hypothetical protein
MLSGMQNAFHSTVSMARLMNTATIHANRLSSSVDRVFQRGGWDIDEVPLLRSGMSMAHRLKFFVVVA